MSSVESPIGEQHEVFEPRHIPKPAEPNPLRPKKDAAQTYEALGKEFITQARSWSELYKAIESIGGLMGSRFYSAAELTKKIDSIRQLNHKMQTGKFIQLGSGSPIFDTLTNAGGLREKVAELIGLDNIRENIAKRN